MIFKSFKYSMKLTKLENNLISNNGLDYIHEDEYKLTHRSAYLDKYKSHLFHSSSMSNTPWDDIENEYGL